MWGDVERGVENRKDAVERQRIHSLEKLLEEKHRDMEQLGREVERHQRAAERERMKVGKLEEDVVAERSRRDAWETKMKRVETRAESAEAEVALQEAALVELAELRSKLRVSEQALSSLRTQTASERSRADECERLLAESSERIARELSSKGGIEHQKSVLEHENAMLKRDVAQLRKETEALREQKDNMLSASSTDAGSLQTRAAQLEMRLSLCDTAVEKLDESKAEVDVANARSRELARQLAVAQQQHGTLDSLSRHQKATIEDLKKQVADLTQTSKLLASRTEQNELSLLMVRTGYSPAREEETLTSVKQQLALEKREHAVLRMQHDDATRQLSALKELCHAQGAHSVSPAALGPPPAHLRNETVAMTPPPPPPPPQPIPSPRLVSHGEESPVWAAQTQGTTATTASPFVMKVVMQRGADVQTPPTRLQRFPAVTPPPTTRLGVDDGKSDASVGTDMDSPRMLKNRGRAGSEAMMRKAALLDAQDSVTVATQVTPMASRLDALVSQQKQLAAQKSSFLMPTAWVSELSRPPD